MIMALFTVFVGIIAFSNLLLLVAIGVLAFSLSKVMNTSVKPVLSEVQSTIKNVNELVGKVESRADHIMQIGEQTASKVSAKVVAASDIVEHTVTDRVVKITSLWAGISRAWEVWRLPTVRP